MQSELGTEYKAYKSPFCRHGNRTNCTLLVNFPSKSVYHILLYNYKGVIDIADTSALYNFQVVNSVHKHSQFFVWKLSREGRRQSWNLKLFSQQPHYTLFLIHIKTSKLLDCPSVRHVASYGSNTVNDTTRRGTERHGHTFNTCQSTAFTG